MDGRLRQPTITVPDVAAYPGLLLDDRDPQLAAYTDLWMTQLRPTAS